MNYIIIGGGIAGTTAAEELCKLDVTAHITIVSEEQHAIYSRVLLPHYIKNKIPRERVFLKKSGGAGSGSAGESWYAQQKIEWARGEIVVKIDPKNQHVVLESGREISYDKLLIATGGEVKLFQDDLKGVSYFRTLDDADHLLELVHALPSSAHAAIYGGGFIACEYLNIFHAFHIPTTIIFRGEHMWSHGISKEAGEILKQHLEKNNVEVFSNTHLTQLIGDKTLEAIETTNGTFSCNLLGVGIGIDSNFSCAREAGVEVKEGIVCDQYLETNLSNIFTAGDVAEFYDPRYGRHIRAGNWMSAMTQGRIVAKNMFGEKHAFDLVSSYATNALGLEIIFIGDTSREAAQETRLFGSIESGGISEIFVRNNQIVGAILIGRNTDRPILTKLISEKADPEKFEMIDK